MDHKYIDEFDMVERYLARKLTAEDTAEFEEHFVDCVECIGRLETTRTFIDGLRIVATSDAAAQAVAARPETSSKNVRFITSRRFFALAAGILLLVAVASALLAFTQIRRYRLEADQARSVSTQWEDRYEEQRQLADANSKEQQEAERELAEQVAHLRLERENEKKPEIRDDVQLNLPILSLSSTSRSERSASADEVTLSRSTARFAVTLSLEGESGYRDYVITIFSSKNEPLLSRRGIKANSDSAISLGFNSTLFQSGSYLLRLEGVARDGRMSVVGTYPFRVRKTP